MNLKNIFDFSDVSAKLAKFKPLGIAAVCFLAVFIAGYGVGKSGVSNSGITTPAKRSLSNYTTNKSPDTKTPAKVGGTSKNTTIIPTNTPANDCPIKGSKSKIYHIKGGSFYERTNPAQCFNTEEEALAAGYIKSTR